MKAIHQFSNQYLPNHYFASFISFYPINISKLNAFIDESIRIMRNLNIQKYNEKKIVNMEQKKNKLHCLSFILF